MNVCYIQPSMARAVTLGTKAVVEPTCGPPCIYDTQGGNIPFLVEESDWIMIDSTRPRSLTETTFVLISPRASATKSRNVNS